MFVLQKDITSISKWFYENNLSVNTRKKCTINVEPRHKANVSRDCRPQINYSMLEQVEIAPCGLDQCLQWAIHNNPSTLSQKVGVP